MHRLLALVLILIAIPLLNSGTPCYAQGAPQGSYLQTCRDIRMDRTALFAYCQDTDGHWRAAELYEFRECTGDITNVDGELRCERRADRGRPYGSYMFTCREIYRRGDRLTAVCQNIGGRWRRSTLDDVDRCVGPIVNDDGQLACTRGGSLPRGSYVETCRQIYLRGGTLRAACQDRDGRWVWTALDGWESCPRGIVNIDGQLRCSREGDREYRDGDRGADRGGDRLPRGDYAQTCRNITVRGGTLRAECQTREGRWVRTELGDVERCRGEIQNIDGQLRCPR
jgi:hypothetical protein